MSNLASLFPGARLQRIETETGIEIAALVMGQGPRLLLLHGHPQTRAIWHKVAPQLAQRFTLVATDLRGYGDSSKPAGAPDHANYSKRTLARDQRHVMRALGFVRFDDPALLRSACAVAARLSRCNGHRPALRPLHRRAGAAVARGRGARLLHARGMRSSTVPSPACGRGLG